MELITREKENKNNAGRCKYKFYARLSYIYPYVCVYVHSIVFLLMFFTSLFE